MPDLQIQHRHPGMERSLGVDSRHAIVDVESLPANNASFTSNTQLALLTEAVAKLSARVTELENGERETWAPYLRALGVNPNAKPGVTTPHHCPSCLEADE